MQTQTEPDQRRIDNDILPLCQMEGGTNKHNANKQFISGQQKTLWLSMNRTQMPNAQIISLQIAAIIFSSSLEMRSQHTSFFTFPFISHLAISHWPCCLPNFSELPSNFSIFVARSHRSLSRNYAFESGT